MHVCIFQSLQLEGSCVGGLLVLLIFLLRFVFTVWRGDEACTSPGPGQEPWCLGPQSERSQVFYVRRSRAQSPRCPRVAQWPLRPGTGPEPRSTGRLRLLSPPTPGTRREWAGQRGPHCASRFCLPWVRNHEALIIPVRWHDVWGALDVCHHGPSRRDRSCLV